LKANVTERPIRSGLDESEGIQGCNVPTSTQPRTDGVSVYWQLETEYGDVLAKLPDEFRIRELHKMIKHISGIRLVKIRSEVVE